MGGLKTVLGIDPGLKSGIAVVEGSELVSVATVPPLQLLEIIKQLAPQTTVVIEDSRLQSHVWAASPARGGRSFPAAAKIARNIGTIDAWCELIEAACMAYELQFVARSPREKGRKLTAEEFRRISGWSKTTNQHERDAAMLALSVR